MADIFRKREKNTNNSVDHIKKEVEAFVDEKKAQKIEQLQRIKTLNPVKKIKIKNEIRKTEKEIEKEKRELEKRLRAEEEKKKNRKILAGCAAALAVCFGVLEINAYNSKIHSISFINNEDTVYVGDYIDLDYIIKPSSAEYNLKDIKVQIDNTDLVEKNNGIQAISEGTIKASVSYKGSTYDQKIINIVPIKVESINVDDTEIGVNLVKKIEAKFVPENCTNKQITYSSSNNDIVKIENDTMIGISEGTAKISAVSQDGPSCTFNVNVNFVEPTSISFENLIDEYYTGRKVQLKILTKPEEISSNDIELSSSNDSVAEILSGNTLCTNDAGKTTITAKYSDEVFCSKEITVMYMPVAGLKLSSEEDSIFAGESMKIDVQYLPEKVNDYTLSWTSSDPEIATVNSNGYVTGKSEGSVMITAESANGKKESIRLNVYKPSEPNYDSRSSSDSRTIVGDGITVYITETGKKYHKNPSCVKYPHAVNIEDAISWGFEPCEKCAQ